MSWSRSAPAAPRRCWRAACANGSKRSLPARIGDLAALMGRYRERFASARHASQSLRRFWERVIDGPIGAPRSPAAGAKPRPRLLRAIESTRHPQHKRRHRVSGRRRSGRSRSADACGRCRRCRPPTSIFYDELVAPEILDRARRDAERVFVGKRRGQPGIGQDEINRRLVEAARNGRNVVRLKGGDPFIFGRGGEELEYLRAAGVPVVRRAGHHRGARLRGGSRTAADLPQRGVAALVRHRASRRRGGRNATGRRSPIRRRRSSSTWGSPSAAAVRDGLIGAGRDPQTPVARAGARHASRCEDRRRPARRTCRRLRRRPAKARRCS